MTNLQRRLPWVRNSIAAGLLAGMAAFGGQALAAEAQYAANFKGTDIQEFINIVGKNLNRTIIVDPTVRGKINVRSYDLLSEEQYYQFFLSVLQVYGYAVVEMPGTNIIKVVKDKDAKDSNIRVADDAYPGEGDEMVTRIVPLYNVEAKQLAPLLRQLNNNAGGGNVVNYDPSNVLMITGRAAVVNKLVEIVKRVDLQGDTKVEVVRLAYASAGEMVRIIDALYRGGGQQAATGTGSVPKVVADERTNSVVISGDERARQRAAALVRELDQEMQNSGNTKVVYLKYAKAEDLQEVLSGFAESLQTEEGGSAQTQRRRNNEITIMAHADSNALVINAQPDQIQTLESVIRQLDIRRAQVLVEAIIVEIAEGDEVGFGVQWGSADGGLIQYNTFGTTIGEVGAGIWDARDVPGTEVCSPEGVCTTNPDQDGDITTLAAALSKVNGMAWGVAMGDFGALIQAVAADSNSNVLATPSITTLDNQEASFIVGDEVPVITGSTSGSNNDNPFTTVERKEVGIKLKVTPQINEGNAVQLEIEQEVSNVNGRTAVDVTFGKRTLTTTVLADSGETVVLGGLLNEDVQESVSKVPLLGDIPVIGHLFSSTSSKKTKRNLMIFIKPTIIRDGPSMTGIAGRKYNYFRAQQLEQAERGINLMPNTDVPVLDEWVVPDGMSPEIHDILMRHQSGQSMSTPIRDQNEWMQKALDGSAQPGDNATDAKEQPVEEKQND
ncbi:general secretion pathway protein D [Ferrimonas balearica DSM 9799]|uniref:General secretion pathway protein D n=1 Tax=Ferrimonas balearica (strain DSM 9799 / CCM 4581 / KCTC 23876 / PAT) TaxID=550540 RepID=E1SL34_FERBD|nr:type II secretion system secretin GspD [Ferrimonas balearica]ADN74428.1 general secretion pathway protein D [Ferrimonas balearica DSM 9799]